ncbi:MAG: Pr6Pr family membrane protein [Candidatus Limnocylindrales bacterium]
MTKQRALMVYRVGFALLALAAIVVQLLDLSGKGTLDPLNYFSYFTIQTNLIGIAVLLLAASGRWDGSHKLDLARGAATTYLAITLVVFAILLSGTDVDTAIPWVDTVLHKIFPIAIMLDWLLDPPLGRITARQAIAWLTYPILWLVYSLIRGGLTGRYPYPFLDPANGGYGKVAITCVAIFVFGSIVIAVVAWVGNRLSERGRDNPIPAIEHDPIARIGRE